MSDEIADQEEALAGLRDLERELSEATNNWTTQTVARRYDPGEDGDEDRADEVMLFREHGYSARIPLGLPNDTVFKRELSASVTSPTTIIRTYRGKQQADAVAWFREDAADLAPDGYAPTSQSWAPGQWGAGAFLVAFLLVFVLVGILVFIYMLLVKPEGTLTVTYTKAFAVGGDSALSTTASTSQALTTPSVGLETLMLLEKLGQLREAGFLTTEEFEAKKADLLARL